MVELHLVKKGLNPFFIRSQGRTTSKGECYIRSNVLIPSSSGLKAGRYRADHQRLLQVLIPSSSGLKAGPTLNPTCQAYKS